MQSVQYTLLHLTKDCLFAPSSSFLRPSATALNPGEEETESSSFCYIHSPSTQKASFALCSIFPRTSFSSRTRMGKSMGFLLLLFPFLLFPFLLAAFSPLAVSQGDFLYFSSLLLCVPSALSLFSLSSFFFSSSSLSLFFFFSLFFQKTLIFQPDSIHTHIHSTRLKHDCRSTSHQHARGRNEKERERGLVKGEKGGLRRNWLTIVAVGGRIIIYM